MNKADNLTKLIITQAICVLIIISSVITVKYFFGGTYKKLLSWYKENICVTTDINEVLSDEV
jgi:hypothetical protein